MAQKTCEHCGGTGQRPCTCKDPKNCKICFGTGRRQCRMCNGTGKREGGYTAPTPELTD